MPHEELATINSDFYKLARFPWICVR